MEVFRSHSGMHNVEKSYMSNFVSRFVDGLQTELRECIQMHVVCWQTKSLDEILQYAKYYDDV